MQRSHTAIFAFIGNVKRQNRTHESCVECAAWRCPRLPMDSWMVNMSYNTALSRRPCFPGSVAADTSRAIRYIHPMSAPWSRHAPVASGHTRALTMSDASLHRAGDASERGADEDERQLVLLEDGVEHTLKLGRGELLHLLSHQGTELQRLARQIVQPVHLGRQLAPHASRQLGREPLPIAISEQRPERGSLLHEGGHARIEQSPEGVAVGAGHKFTPQ
mmetsp:Transcript_41527/g.110290  ORF Transcript_41527/g.110290 Transcript_41527/m.110290 type:complete len:219 (-) Transcript_41527:1197-1853(-)